MNITDRQENREYSLFSKNYGQFTKVEYILGLKIQTFVGARK